MFLAELLIALFIGLVVAAIFTYGFRRPGPWGGFLWFFLIVFLGAWALGIWVRPFGPLAWGVAWVPIVIGALFIALVVAAFPSMRHPEAERRTGERQSVEPGMGAEVGAFFWALVIAMLFVIAFGYWL